MKAPNFDVGCYFCRKAEGMDAPTLTMEDRCEWHNGFQEGLKRQALTQPQDEAGVELMECWKEAYQFIDLHSEDWYKRGQRLLERMRSNECVLSRLAAPKPELALTAPTEIDVALEVADGTRGPMGEDDDMGIYLATLGKEVKRLRALTGYGLAVQKLDKSSIPDDRLIGELINRCKESPERKEFFDPFLRALLAAPKPEPSGEALEPCPFCGGKAERIDIPPSEAGIENAGGSYIACRDCMVSTAVMFGEKVGLNEKWNRRALLSTQPSEVSHG